MSFSRDEVLKLLSETDIVDVIGRHVTLKKVGAEYKGLCPFHDDKKPTLSVNPVDQRYKCFGCGAGYGDSIDFLQRLGSTFQQALNEIKDPNNTAAIPLLPIAEKRAIYKAKANSWKQVVPAPKPPKEFFHYRHGLASMVWAYHDIDSNIVGYVCRFDLPEGKEVLPFVYCWICLPI
jgi:hypothetical protein